MEIGYGHRYVASVDNLSLTTSFTGDLIAIDPGANVPIVVDRIVCTANVLTGVQLRMVLVGRSTASTGGTAVVPKASSPSSPSASTAITYLAGTIGTMAGTPYDSQEWNQFAPYEYNVRPGGILISPSIFLGLYIPAVPTTAVNVSFTLEFVELK